MSRTERVPSKTSWGISKAKLGQLAYDHAKYAQVGQSIACSTRSIYVIEGYKDIATGKFAYNVVYRFDWWGTLQGEYQLKKANGSVITDEAENVFLTTGANAAVFVGFNDPSAGTNDYYVRFDSIPPV